MPTKIDKTKCRHFRIVPKCKKSCSSLSNNENTQNIETCTSQEIRTKSKKAK